jgi:hypothetical protein
VVVVSGCGGASWQGALPAGVGGRRYGVEIRSLLIGGGKGGFPFATTLERRMFTIRSVVTLTLGCFSNGKPKI